MANIDEKIPGAVTVHIRSPRRVLYRVPVQVRRGKKHIYEPEVVPLGPYHHRSHPQRQLVEPLKNELRDMVCANNKPLFLSKILRQIDDIRHFYDGAGHYTDDELAEIMLRDACFLVCYMQVCSMQVNETKTLICQRLGMSGMLFMFRDMYMLENQIPLWLISLIHPHQSLLCEYLSYNAFGDNRMTHLPWGNGRGEEPLHLLEASHRTHLSLVETRESSSNCLQLIKKHNQLRSRKKSSTTLWQERNSQFRSVTDLKAKGIHFRRSSNCLTDVKFFSFAFYAQLHLPFFYISNNRKVFLSNLIAFEMSPEAADTNFGVTSYVYFMKTLINNAEDVKVLREKGILYSLLASDEEVVEMFKSIDTYGFSNRDLFLAVTMRIDEHCNNKGRTWMADLINTKLRSPWTVIALAAATFLLCLTFLQTYFTIHPRS
ncbi:UPF0481 protein [Salvia divinorum]|uniref:UPF0481 protein n=1 Tax=Salvia divinorum TaxID=28513 RepID=A0ABD1IK05_SALDI